MAMTETKIGKITQVIYNNESNGFAICLFETEDEQFKISGTFHAINREITYKLEGCFKNHPRYGEQFNVSGYEEQMPDDAEGIRIFLASGAIRGIGANMAGRIVDKFGKESLDIIDEDPDALLCINGLGPKTVDKIVKSYRESREFTKISLGLGEYGVMPSQAVRIYKLYGDKSLEVVRQNPYTLVEDIYGISFSKADEIAGKIGIEQKSEFRVQSGIKYALSVFAGNGSTHVPKDVLIESSIRLLDVSGELIEENLVALAFSGQIETDSLDGVPVVYQHFFYRAEQSVTFHIKRIMNGFMPPTAANVDNLINAAEAGERIRLSGDQRKAIRAALTNKITIITGGPGTGKTTIINLIVKIFKQMGISVALAAPTGRAAKRITETAGVEAMTIHRLLEYVYSEDDNQMEFGRNEDNPLEEDAFIVDEASMIDLMLMDGFLQALDNDSRLIIVGDADQLPSVGAGNILHDMINSEYVPTIRLEEIFRQAGESHIVVNAHSINNGEYPEFNGKDSDFFFMHRSGEADIRDTIEELVTGRLASYYDFVKDSSDVQVLTPTRKGGLGTASLNELLQSVINPAMPARNERKFGSKTLREGDKVMQIRNNYRMEWQQLGRQSGRGIFNGDMGVINTIDTDNAKVIVDFDGKFVTYDNEELDELELAYAVTVHKSQGCEFPAVIIPISGFPPMLATRNLLYTAITRGKKLVILVGSEERMQRMIDNNRIDERYTGLEDRLREIDLGRGLT